MTNVIICVIIWLKNQIKVGGVMARPKTGKPRKQNLTLTVETQTRLDLDFISKYRQKSISELLAVWTKTELYRISEEKNNTK